MYSLLVQHKKKTKNKYLDMIHARIPNQTATLRNK